MELGNQNLNYEVTVFPLPVHRSSACVTTLDPTMVRRSCFRDLHIHEIVKFCRHIFDQTVLALFLYEMFRVLILIIVMVQIQQMP